jgi:hypothetical protein
LRASNRRESFSSRVEQYITGTAAGSSTKQQTTQLVFAEDDTKEQEVSKTLIRLSAFNVIKVALGRLMCMFLCVVRVTLMHAGKNRYRSSSLCGTN